jgi:hypothetical protein
VTDFPAIKAVLEAALLNGETATRKQAWREYEQARGFHLVAHAYAGKAHELQVDLETVRANIEQVVRDEHALYADRERLREAITRYLDNDGSRGCFDAVALADARRELEAALGSGTPVPQQRSRKAQRPNPESEGGCL